MESEIHVWRMPRSTKVRELREASGQDMQKASFAWKVEEEVENHGIRTVQTGFNGYFCNLKKPEVMCTHETARSVGRHLVFSDNMRREAQHQYTCRVLI